MPLVRVAGLTGGYNPARPAIEDLDFEVGPGRLVAVLGPNGGGKTSLFRALLNELPLREGDVHVAGRPAYVPQIERARLDYPVTALDVALMGAYARTPWWSRLAPSARAAARAALDRVGLADDAGTLFGELSGGQRQRVALARALVQDSPVLLLDEPLSGVDRASATRIEELFGELRAEGRAILVATHDIHQAHRCDEVLCLHRSQIAFGPPASTLTAETLKATYGAELIELADGRLAVAVDHHHH